MRVGHIDYVNSLPLYDSLLENELNYDFEIISEHPSTLNKMMAEGLLDLSPVSSIEYAFHQKEYVVLNPFCINSKGAVYSVLLVSKKPIQELNHARIGLTKASATARSICKILLNDCYGFSCEYVDVTIENAGKLENLDAELVIGDLAFLLRKKQPYCYDVAEVWLEKVNKPIVFAIWVARKEFAQEQPHHIASFEKLLKESYQIRNLKRIREKSKKLLKIGDSEVDDYFTALGYDFNQEAREALLFYYKLASKNGLCPTCETLVFWSQNEILR